MGSIATSRAIPGARALHFVRLFSSPPGCSDITRPSAVFVRRPAGRRSVHASSQQPHRNEADRQETIRVQVPQPETSRDPVNLAHGQVSRAFGSGNGLVNGAGDEYSPRRRWGAPGQGRRWRPRVAARACCFCVVRGPRTAHPAAKPLRFDDVSPPPGRLAGGRGWPYTWASRGRLKAARPAQQPVIRGRQPGVGADQGAPRRLSK